MDACVCTAILLWCHSTFSLWRLVMEAQDNVIGCIRANTKMMAKHFLYHWTGGWVGVANCVPTWTNFISILGIFGTRNVTFSLHLSHLNILKVVAIVRGCIHEIT